MSRIGKKPIALPSGVEIILKDRDLTVKGPKGQLSLTLMDVIDIAVEDKSVRVLFDENQPRKKKFFGLTRALVQNMVTGTSEGFCKKLQLVGIGYRAAVAGKTLKLELGYSHPVEEPIPDGISIDVVKGTEIAVNGINKQQVGQYAAIVRSKRPPEPYKGKGVRYVGEYVRKKAGKTKKK